MLNLDLHAKSLTQHVEAPTLFPHIFQNYTVILKENKGWAREIAQNAEQTIFRQILIAFPALHGPQTLGSDPKCKAGDSSCALTSEGYHPKIRGRCFIEYTHFLYSPATKVIIKDI